MGINAVRPALLKRKEVVKQLPKMALRLVELKLVKDEKPAKSCAKAVGAKS